MATIAGHTLNGLAFGMLLFLVASGLTLSFGLMRLVNLAHGSLYLMGGYIALDVLSRTGSYSLALLAAVAIVVLAGLLLEQLLARLHEQELPQIVLTIGIALVIGDLLLWIYGGRPKLPPTPPYLAGSVHLLGIVFPRYRLSLIAIGAVTALGLGLLLQRTKIGAMVRSAVDDQPIARAMGVRVPLLFVAVFAAGSALAAFAGVWGGAFTGTYPGVDFQVVLLALAVVIVGGLGSVRGALLGAVLVGLLDEFGKSYFTQYALFSIYAPVVLILLVRPRGLFGRET